MMILFPILAAASCMAGSTTFANQSAAATPREATDTHVLAPAGKILGLSVHNSSEKNLGEIGDLLLDPNSGEIRYAILEVGGFLGMGEAQRIVPWAYIQVMPNEKELNKFHAATNLTEAQVKAAPTCKGDEVYGEDLDRRVEAAFGSNRDWAYHGEGKPAFVKASEMKVKLEDATGREVGEVEGMVLAPQNACVAFAIVDTSKEAGDKIVAVYPFTGRTSEFYELSRNQARNDTIHVGVATAMRAFAHFERSALLPRKQGRNDRHACSTRERVRRCALESDSLRV